ncbi:MAG: hypothetical protein COS43_02140 [Gallionellales bacterium CG03_land_8_20_14_0_80_55_15]|nr:MAG: hypothetical protein COS43_02140 [Gallionellales bacterium CG03_land_8_20_14_0_80_55_15]PIX04343.1 MAG: hypothetical protein COZ77_07000 [Gallionellales bacterium CG_4_8_14_3_um_filter_54_18]PJC05895.1 MAG: hypothetical protein CO070_00205 [Gallionellales bacterium CG_4_9_14_0_8_um_filter_55_61]
MYPVYDVDALLLLAMSLASKRRPAELVEIIAAIELNQGAIATEAKLGDAFHRLSEGGLIVEVAGCYTLTADAEKILSGQRRKAGSLERILSIKENLSAYNPVGEHVAIEITPEQMSAAMQEHRASGKETDKNLLMPKEQTVEPVKKSGNWNNFAASRHRKY